MPTNYALRSPIYAFATSTVSTTQSAKCLVSVAGTVVYTIIKSASANTTANFEIAELVRDYLQIVYIGNPQFVVFTSTIQFFDQANAGGTAQATPVTTTSGNGLGMTLQVITDNTLKLSPVITITAPIPTLAAIGTYITPLIGGTGTGATGSVIVVAGAGNNAAAPTYTQVEFVTSGSGYITTDVLSIPAGALSNGNLLTATTLNLTQIPTTSNTLTVTNVPIVTSTGQGATVDILFQLH